MGYKNKYANRHNRFSEANDRIAFETRAGPGKKGNGKKKT